MTLTTVAEKFCIRRDVDNFCSKQPKSSDDQLAPGDCMDGVMFGGIVPGGIDQEFITRQF